MVREIEIKTWHILTVLALVTIGVLALMYESLDAFGIDVPDMPAVALPSISLTDPCAKNVKEFYDIYVQKTSLPSQYSILEKEEFDTRSEAEAYIGKWDSWEKLMCAMTESDTAKVFIIRVESDSGDKTIREIHVRYCLNDAGGLHIPKYRC